MPARLPEGEVGGEERLSGSLGEEIAIAGISGRFPQCQDIQEFKDALMAGVDLVTDEQTRWPNGNAYLIIPSFPPPNNNYY
jgi:fatty acid synthase